MRKVSDIAAAADADLVGRMAAGDEAAFRELLSRYQGLVYGYARRMLGDESLAEDVAQETFLRLYRNALRFRPEGTIKGYLLRICRNLCLDNLRVKGLKLVDEMPEQITETTPHSQLEGKQAALALDRALQKLPPNQRSAVVLRHGQGLAYAEIAEVMQTSVGAVESLLVRARRALRDSLSVYCNI